MDNITHTLTGLALSRAGLNRWYSHSALVLVLAANAPDIDIVMALRGSLPYFENHRGLTHAIVMVPVLALLVALLVCAFTRSMRGWKAAYGLAIIGVASHLLLDWTNSYGVRLLLPFSPDWFRLDLNNIIDLWIWGILLLATLGPLLGRLVSSEIGAKPGSGRGLAIFALSFLLVYDASRYFVHQHALDILNSRVYQGGAPLRVAAFPTSIANPFKWTGWIDRPAFAMRFSMDRHYFLQARARPGYGGSASDAPSPSVSRFRTIPFVARNSSSRSRRSASCRSSRLAVPILCGRNRGHFKPGCILVFPFLVAAAFLEQTGHEKRWPVLPWPNCEIAQG
jgi:membrane-bound metal-dependent hydrolase YbcI (DUF457 family)